MKIYIYVLLQACILYQLSFASLTQATPHLPTAFSLAGTRELAAGSTDAALLAVKSDSLGTDSTLRLYKLGVINAHAGDNAAAIEAFNAVRKKCSKLAPLASEQLGDIAVKEGDFSQAMASYSSVLGSAGLPLPYKQHIFTKIKAIAGNGITLPKGVSWVEEYRNWERRQRMFTAAGLEAICDSLIAIGNVAEADSILAHHLPEQPRQDACRIVDRIFQKRPANDTAMVSTHLLFTLASQAAGCRNFALADRMMSQAQKRANFSKAIPAKASKLLTAKIAYGQEKWQKAIDLYKKYDIEHVADSEALTHIARAYRSLGNTAQMTQWQNAHIKRFPAHQQSQEILWLRAWDQEQSGNFKSAAANYKRISGTRGKRTEEAHVRHALCYYKMKLYDSTIVHLKAFRKAFPNSSYFWSGLFWQGKAHMEAGRTNEAHKVWNEIVKLDPDDYHAHRAMQLMGMADSGTGKYFDEPANTTPMPEPMVRAWLDSIPSPSAKKKLSAADSVALRRGAALLSVARPDIATFFLDNYESNYPGNLLLQYDLASAYVIAGSGTQSYRVARRMSWRIPTGYRGYIPAQVQFLIYPQHFSSLIRKYAEQFNLDPLFVSSVMRMESTFDSSLVSHAGAIGLMQIIPTTGKSISSELKEKNFITDSLYNAELNIRYGTYYLRKRMTQFNNNLAMTLGAYNGGAHNVVKWNDRSDAAKRDIYLEDIGFLETRIYVKKILGYYWTYQRLATTPGYDG